MTTNYDSLLSNEQKRSILTQRLTQFASEAYQHQLNLQIAKTVGNEEGVVAANEALATLDNAISLHQEELAKLGD